jgi:hypothetical protein
MEPAPASGSSFLAHVCGVIGKGQDRRGITTGSAGGASAVARPVALMPSCGCSIGQSGPRARSLPAVPGPWLALRRHASRLLPDMDRSRQPPSDVALRRAAVVHFDRRVSST